MARRKAPVVWFEIPVTDFARAEAFYGAVFGWTFTDTGGSGAPYRLVDAGDSIAGGLSQKAADAAPGGPGPVFYVQVSDVEATVLRAQRHGATLAREPTFLSREAGVVAWLRDPDGNVVGLWAAE